MNEVSFRTRPHHRVHRTLGVDARATGPRWRVDSIEGSEVGGGVVGKSITTNLGYFSSGRFLIGKGLNVYCFYN
jgi:hypothetical protein